MRTGLTNNRNVLTATTHRSAATPMYLQYPKYVVGVECALHMAYKHLICKCKNLFAFAEFQFANLMVSFTNVCYNVTMYFDKVNCKSNFRFAQLTSGYAKSLQD